MPAGSDVALHVRRHLPLTLLRLGLGRAGIATSIAAIPPHCAAVVSLGAAPAGGIPVHRADPSWWTTESDEPVPMVSGPDLPMARLVTSGTTGAPKSVVVTHARFAARCERLLGALPPPHPIRMMCTIAPPGAAPATAT